MTRTSSDQYHCSRCGTPFPDDEHQDERADWAVINEGEEVVCPGCATPLERLWEELDSLR
jgi:DNA-directed RNA polymerase subunit RPC12/RpoP